MSSSQKLQAIFDREIDRLHKLEFLDEADLARLNTLVTSYSKYKAQDFKEHDDLDNIPTEELLEHAKK